MHDVIIGCSKKYCYLFFFKFFSDRVLFIHVYVHFINTKHSMTVTEQLNEEYVNHVNGTQMMHITIINYKGT